MKKLPIIIFAIVDILIVALICTATIFISRTQDELKLNVYLGESHADTRNIAQLFYTVEGEKFSTNSVLTEMFADDLVVFNISQIDFKNDVLRLDPFNMKTDFTISKLEVAFGEHPVFSVEGKDLENYVEKTKGLKKKFKDEGIVCKSKKDNPRIFLNSAFSQRIYHYIFLLNKASYAVLFALFLLIGIIQIIILRDKEKSGVGKKGIVIFVISEILLTLGVVLVYVVFFFEKNFGQVPIGQLLYHLHTPLDGTDISSYTGNIIKGVALTLSAIIISTVIFVIFRRKRIHFGYTPLIYMLSVMLVFTAMFRFITHYEVIDYYKYTHESTTLYEDNYVDGRNIKITFPEKKRNLIYIFLESIEVTFADAESGGGMQANYIPELTELAMENNSFSDGTKLNGAYHVLGATYTMGGMAAQTAGVPINENLVDGDTLNGDWESENNYLPGVWTIGDVLKEEGYNQELLIGSKGTFAGRSSYFKGHGDYRIADYPYMIENKRLPEDYKVWWGFEDQKLFEFAKEDLTKLSAMGSPFNLTLLTVDTHATGGYKCELCKDEFAQQYSNVVACSSRQVTEFVRWVQQQDFYENTTIVMCGDHLVPDSMYVASEGVEGFDRRTYTVVINPAPGVEYNGTGRSYTTLDMYPTTLAAMGVEIEGDKLGLGVNLYSDTPTLVEKYGNEKLNIELMKNSKFYKNELLYK